MINLDKTKKIHIVGIEGAGTSALARILKRMGIEVSGSDEGDHFYFSVLKNEGIIISHEFSPTNIPTNVDLIIYGSSFKPETNAELKAAVDSKKQLVSYSEALALVFNGKYGIAVSGTHGKSTTSAFLCFVLKTAGKYPSAVIGAKVPQLDGNSIIGQSEYFIIEADEYQNKLARYQPKGAILTSIDWDHPDFFPDMESYKKVFCDFTTKIPKTGFLLVWGDAIDTLEAAECAKCETITYGFGEENHLRITDLENILPSEEDHFGKQKFQVKFDGDDLGTFEIKLLGKHNALNAAAVVGVCLKLGISPEKIREALPRFKGISRRMDFIGKRNGALIFDDYGHHPEEIKATLKAVRENYQKKNIITVFHPHSFSRTEKLLEDFAQSFDDADEVIVLDIYGSARETSGKVSSVDLVNLINKYQPQKARHIPSIEDAFEVLKDKIREGDLILSIGAGNVFELANRLNAK